MALINCKIELKLKWKKNYVLSAAGSNNENDRSDDIMFTIKDAKLYILVVTLSARDEQKLSKFLSKIFEWWFYWNEHETKSENKSTLKKFRYSLESNFVGVNSFFVSVYLNQDSNSKRFKNWEYYLLKGRIKNHSKIVNGKIFYE